MNRGRGKDQRVWTMLMCVLCRCAEADDEKGIEGCWCWSGQHGAGCYCLKRMDDIYAQIGSLI